MGGCVSSQSKTEPAPEAVDEHAGLHAAKEGGGGGDDTAAAATTPDETGADGRADESGESGAGGGPGSAPAVVESGGGAAVTVTPAGKSAVAAGSAGGGGGGKVELTVVVVGLDNAGKTTVVNNLLGAPDDFVMPTMGFDLDRVRRRHFDAKIYGLGGASGIRGYWHNYFDEVHAVVFVVDSADAARLDEVSETLREVRAAARVGGKPLLVYANKQDLAEALTAAELAARLGLTDAGFGDSPIHVRQCVALTDPDSENPAVREPDAGVVAAFDWLLDAVEADFGALCARVAKDKAEREALEKQRMAEQKARVARYRQEEEEEEAKAKLLAQAEADAREAEGGEGRPASPADANVAGGVSQEHSAVSHGSGGAADESGSPAPPLPHAVPSPPATPRA